MSNANERLARLEAKAEQLRKDIVVTTEHIGYSHRGGGFSMVEMAVALYYDFLNWSPEQVDDPDRDRFILSKGHCGHVLYNILVDKGLYTKEELWSEYNQVGGRFGMRVENIVCINEKGETEALNKADRSLRILDWYKK